MILLFILMIKALRFLFENLPSSQQAEDIEEPHFQLMLILWCFFLNLSHCLMKGSQAHKPARIYTLSMLDGTLAISAKHCFPLKHSTWCYANLLSKYHSLQVIMCFLLYLPLSLQWLFCGISDTKSGKPIAISLLCILVKGPDLLLHAEAHLRYATPSGVAGTLYRRMYSCISGKLCLT